MMGFIAIVSTAVFAAYAWTFWKYVQSLIQKGDKLTLNAAVWTMLLGMCGGLFAAVNMWAFVCTAFLIGGTFCRSPATF